MRLRPYLGLRLPLPWPFYGGLRVQPSPHRRRVWHGTLPGWRCHHDHRTPEAATECARREARRRSP